MAISEAISEFPKPDQARRQSRLFLGINAIQRKNICRKEEARISKDMTTPPHTQAMKSALKPERVAQNKQGQKLKQANRNTILEAKQCLSVLQQKSRKGSRPQKGKYNGVGMSPAIVLRKFHENQTSPGHRNRAAPWWTVGLP